MREHANKLSEMEKKGDKMTREEFDDELEKMEEEIHNCVIILKKIARSLLSIKVYINDNDDFV